MIARAPGKIVLSGAYSVLEGAPSIVAAVDRFVIADASREATFETEEDQSSMQLGPHPYHIELKISLGKDFLELELGVTNPGAEAFEFT